MSLPEPADPEVAAATFAEHLNKFFANPRHAVGGWGRTMIDALTAVITIPATRPDSTIDPHFVKLEAHWYDLWAPRVTFVEPTQGWPTAQPGSRHYPIIVGSPLPSPWQPAPGSPTINFALHPAYQMTYGEHRQLACFSHSFDYYFSSHSPTDDQRWQQGVHTASATLTRLHRALQAPNYAGPCDAAHT